MSDYEKYVTEVNNIEEINEYKNPVIQVASFLQNQLKNNSTDDEELLS